MSHLRSLALEGTQRRNLLDMEAPSDTGALYFTCVGPVLGVVHIGENTQSIVVEF